MTDESSFSKLRVIVVSVLAGAGLMYAMEPATVSAAELYKTVYSQFYEKDNPHAALINATEAKFIANDVEGALEGLHEDFAMFEVTPEGPEERVRGIEATRKALTMSFGTGKWLGASVYKWGLTDNTLVQIEEDHFETDGEGEKIVRTLVVFEFKDGKRWREWRFKPQAN
jgi:hypothetical protein